MAVTFNRKVCVFPARSSGLHRATKRSLALCLAMVILSVGMTGCRRGDRPEDLGEEDLEEVGTQLVLENVTLEQPGEEGELLWNIQAETATYDEEQQRAVVTQPFGRLYEDGTAVYEVQSDRGIVRQDGERLRLQDNVVVTDLRSGAVLRMDVMIWVPEDGVLTLQDNIVGTHPDVEFIADRGRWFSREQRLELNAAEEGELVAITTDPKARLTAEQMMWYLEEERLESDRPVQVQKLDENDEVTDNAEGNSVEVDLAKNIVTLTEEAQVALQDPPAQAASDELIWSLSDQILESKTPITVVLPEDQVTLTSNEARMNTEEQIFYFTGNVQATATRDQSRMTSDRLTWNAETKDLLAEGNVFYQQSDPPLTLRGPRLTGTLDNQIFVVSGGRVVTEIIPQGGL